MFAHIRSHGEGTTCEPFIASAIATVISSNRLSQVLPLVVDVQGFYSGHNSTYVKSLLQRNHLYSYCLNIIRMTDNNNRPLKNSYAKSHINKLAAQVKTYNTLSPIPLTSLNALYSILTFFHNKVSDICT